MKKIILILLVLPIIAFGQDDYDKKPIIMDINNFTTDQLIETYSDIIDQLKERGVIRTKNLIGDLGEYHAIEHFNKSPNKSNLNIAPPGTKNIDAISRDGDRYSVKSTTGNTTGVFHGLEGPDSEKKDTKKFEYVLVVMFNDNFKLDKILEIDWNLFLKHKRWHGTMKAWNLSITKALLSEAEIIYQR
jgi:hypothetical protein